jgi:N-acetylneuraminic acid mutarotase
VTNVSGTIPSERYGHSAVVIENKMYVFGGCDSLGRFNNDLFVYNFDKKRWKQLTPSGTLPKARHFHTAVVHDGCIWVFGGKSNGYMNDLLCLNLKTMSWEPQEYFGGKPPSKRYGHTAVVHNKCMYVFGGYDDFGYKTNELYEYRFDSHEWRKIETYGDCPEKFHHSAVVHGNSMYVFGGSDCSNVLLEYRFGTRTWAKVWTIGKPPDGRWGHSAVVHKNKMWIVGGCDNVIHFKDVHKFDFEKCKWSRPPCNGFEPRYFHSGVLYNNRLYYFAGRNVHKYCFNELYQYSYDIYSDLRQDTYLNDMKKLLNKSDFSDIVFVFPNENSTKIFAHKGILEIRCESFRLLLKSGMKESIENKVEITDVSSKAFSALLEYLYTNQLPKLTPPEILEVLKLSDRYMLEHLKGLTERLLKKCIDMNNVNTLFMIADQYKAPKLRHWCVKFGVKYYDVLVKEKKFDPSSPFEGEVQSLLENSKANFNLV